MNDGIVARVIEMTNNPQEININDATPTETIDVKEHDPIKAEPPLGKYQQEKGRPYTVDYFKMDFWNELTPQLDTEGWTGKVDKIEKFVADEIKRKDLKDTIGSYQEIMGNIQSQVSSSPNEGIENKIDRVINYIKLTKQKMKMDAKRDRWLEEYQKLTGSK